MAIRKDDDDESTDEEVIDEGDNEDDEDESLDVGVLMPFLLMLMLMSVEEGECDSCSGDE